MFFTLLNILGFMLNIPSVGDGYVSPWCIVNRLEMFSPSFWMLRTTGSNNRNAGRSNGRNSLSA